MDKPHYEEKKHNKIKKTISDIKLEFTQASVTELPALLDEYSSDHRKGVKRLCMQFKSRLQAYYSELARIDTMNSFDRQYLPMGSICGIDEVGRGPLAGPVVACAIILPRDCQILYVNDSKQLSEKKREKLYNEIIDSAICYGIGMVSPDKIDELNILQATYEAMRQAISSLSEKPDLILNDAVTIPGVETRQVPIVKGDMKSMSIAAASIIAKVTRDRMMIAYDKIYPEYNFANNKGYGSKDHIDAIKTKGVTPIHRKSFIGNIV